LPIQRGHGGVTQNGVYAQNDHQSLNHEENSDISYLYNLYTSKFIFFWGYPMFIDTFFFANRRVVARGSVSQPQLIAICRDPEVMARVIHGASRKLHDFLG